MKRKLILTLLACGASALPAVSARAQTPETSSTTSATTPEGHHGGGMLDHLTDALGLSGTQAAAIAPILESATQQIHQIHEQAKQQADGVINSASSQITPLLNAQQQEKFTQLVQAFENGHGGSGHGGAHALARQGGGKFAGHASPADQLAWMTKTLGLDANQQDQIKPIIDAAHAQVTAIFANTSLTRDQKMAQVKETLKGAHDQINGLLNAQQQAQFAQITEKFHHHRPGTGAPGSPSTTVTTSTNAI
jgi:hypothetical protein